MNRVTCISTLLVAVLAAAGCYSPGGWMMRRSGGTVTYYSTQTMPATITIVDTRTEEPFFSIEIPPGKQLTIDFVADKGDNPVETPDLLRYELFPLGTWGGSLTNAVTVPNAACRRIDVEYRAAPEAPPTPPEEALRADRPEERPSWWTPQGGELPTEKSSTQTIYDD